MKTKPKFETNADTWGTCRFPVMTSVAKELGSIIEPLKKGDEYHDGESWRESTQIGLGAVCGNAYRRLIS